MDFDKWWETEGHLMADAGCYSYVLARAAWEAGKGQKETEKVYCGCCQNYRAFAISAWGIPPVASSGEACVAAENVEMVDTYAGRGKRHKRKPNEINAANGCPWFTPMQVTAQRPTWWRRIWR